MNPLELLLLNFAVIFFVIISYLIFVSIIAGIAKSNPQGNLPEQFASLKRWIPFILPIGQIAFRKQIIQLQAALRAIEIGRPKEAQSFALPIIQKPATPRLARQAHKIAALTAMEMNLFEDSRAHLLLGRGLHDPAQMATGDQSECAVLASIDARLGDFASAQKWLSETLTTDANTRRAIGIVHANIAANHAKYDLALALLLEASEIKSPIDKNPTLGAAHIAEQARYLLLLNRSNDALPLITTAMSQVNPTHKMSILITAINAWALATTGKLHQALKLASQAESRLASIPDELQLQGEILISLARAKMAANDFTNAIKFWNRAIAICIAPTILARLYWNLAQCHLATNDSRLAREACEKGAAQNVTTPDCENCRSALTSPST